jgi:glutamyl-Q tRNA(Asp) synthetase
VLTGYKQDDRAVTDYRIFPEIIHIVPIQPLPPLLSFGMAIVRTRFAPSVTGHLHLGHAVNAVYTWGVAGARRGEVIIRLEDHDRGRFRPEYEGSILADLEWLGLTGARSRQSDHDPRYRAAAERLCGAGRAFWCDCTRKRCSGGCRDRALADGPGRALRFRVTEGVERFDDLRLGAQDQEPAAQGEDFVLRDTQGQWTYQHCVVADDIAEGITLVIRGEDILESTGRQLQLFRALGHSPPPRYLHHPLVTDASGRKLSKKDFARSLGDLRREGWTPERVLGEAAFLGGLTPAVHPIGADTLASLFDGS